MKEAFRINKRFMSDKNTNEERQLEQKQSNFDEEDKDEEKPVVLYSRVLAIHRSQLRKEAYYRRVNAEMEKQIDRLLFFSGYTFFLLFLIFLFISIFVNSFLFPLRRINNLLFFLI